MTLGNPSLTEIYLFCHLQGCRNIEEQMVEKEIRARVQEVLLQNKSNFLFSAAKYM